LVREAALRVNAPGGAGDDARLSADCDGDEDAGEEGPYDIHPPARTTIMMITARSTGLRVCITGQVHTG